MPINYNKLAAKELDGVTPCLVRIDYEWQGEPESIYLTDNGKSIWWDGNDNSASVTGTGNEYLPAAIKVELPDEIDGTGAKITIGVADQQLSILCRQLDESPTFTIVAAYVDNPLGSPIISRLDGQTAKLTNISGTAAGIQASLNSGLALGFNFPREKGNIALCPGLA
jgi:hypothetical protein